MVLSSNSRQEGEPAAAAICAQEAAEGVRARDRPGRSGGRNPERVPARLYHRQYTRALGSMYWISLVMV